MRKQPPVAADLYWMLPGPKNFIRRIARAAMENRMVFVNLPRQHILGTWQGVMAGLRDAQVDDPKEILVTGGNDIAAEIGVHLGLDRISPESLASHVASCRMAFILRPDSSEKAQANAEKFAEVFMQTPTEHCGNVTLAVGISNESLTQDGRADGFQIIVFDGGLSMDEMEAYVSLRMLDHPGPGSTRLNRALISEFAGFDVELAEQLIAMSEAQIVAIQEQLPELASHQTERGRTSSWLDRTLSICQPSVTHVFHDFYLSRHGSEVQRGFAGALITSRYWRACVKTITPWLEERRTKVLRLLDSEINRIAVLHGGKIPIPRGDGKTRAVEPEALEYNNIVGMVYSGKELIIRTPQEQAAVDVCCAVKKVRDDIAHLRPPAPVMIQDMIRKMDQLLK